MAQQFKKFKPAEHRTGWREKRQNAFIRERRRATEDKIFAARYAARVYA